MSDRSSLSILVLIALFSWGGLLMFTYIVPPHAFLAFIALFLIMAVALTSTVAPIAYMIGRLFSPPQPTIQSSIRRGALVALIVILNLMLRVWSSWNVFTAILIVLAVIVVEVIALARK
jgi:hypothetical protein